MSKTRKIPKTKELDGRQVYSAKALAEKLGYNEQHVRKLARDGEIPGAHLIGSRWFFDLTCASKSLRKVVNSSHVQIEKTRYSDEDILRDPLIGY